MIWFLIVAGLLSMAALAVLLRPMIRPSQPGAAAAEEPVAALYRRQLAAIDEELAEGRLTQQQAATSRTEITRRLLAAADREAVRSDAAAGRPAETSWRFGAAVAVAGILPAAALAVYFTVGTPAAFDRRGAADAAAPHGAAALAAAADQIRAHLKEAPNDLRGWTMLGRTLASLGRFPEARDAYDHAIALSPADAKLHAELGEVLVLAAEGRVTPAAEAEFAKAPDDPRSRYYDADAALQRGDAAGARQKLQALLAGAPADAPWRQAVADRLAELSANGQPATAAPASPQSPGAQSGPSPQGPGPSAQDIAAARSMSPEQREAMIRGMVERLAQRLEHDPGDGTGWARLAHAYDVLGEPDKARAARARAAAANAGARATTAPATPSAVAPSDPKDSQRAPDRPRPDSQR